MIKRVIVTCVLGVVGIGFGIRYFTVIANSNTLVLEIPMLVENHFIDDNYPNNPVIQFELEDLNEYVFEEDSFNRVVTFEGFAQGEMTFNFGGFELEEVGVFEYRVFQVVHEDLLERENWNLDLALFYITIVVTESVEHGRLNATYTILERVGNDESLSVDNITFINTYDNQ